MSQLLKKLQEGIFMPLLLAFVANGYAQSIPCAADLYWQQQPDHQIARQAVEEAIHEWITSNEKIIFNRSLITIPVVVHVVWRTPEENISDAQIQSQIEALNRDFQARNTEIARVPAIFRSAIATIDFEFCLAQTDPNGNATTGITRTRTPFEQIGARFAEGRRAICFTNLGGQDAWDTRHYLNIWVGQCRPVFIGEASFPGMASPDTDGIRMDPTAFGTMGTARAPYNLGRTLVHEIGHFFNLFHLWGAQGDLENLNCDQDDGVADTPRQAFSYRGECPVHPQISCGSADMFMNFMNYTNDACMAMFSQGQKIRMLAALHTFRAGLLTAAGACVRPVAVPHRPNLESLIQVMQNPAHRRIHLQRSSTISTEPLRLRIFHTDGRLLFEDQWMNGTDYQKDFLPLSAGCYFIIIENSYGTFCKKIVLSH